jgi:hypothetical protein
VPAREAHPGFPAHEANPPISARETNPTHPVTSPLPRPAAPSTPTPGVSRAAAIRDAVMAADRLAAYLLGQPPASPGAMPGAAAASADLPMPRVGGAPAHTANEANGVQMGQLSPSQALPVSPPIGVNG